MEREHYEARSSGTEWRNRIHNIREGLKPVVPLTLSTRRICARRSFFFFLCIDRSMNASDTARLSAAVLNLIEYSSILASTIVYLVTTIYCHTDFSKSTQRISKS